MDIPEEIENARIITERNEISRLKWRYEIHVIP